MNKISKLTLIAGMILATASYAFANGAAAACGKITDKGEVKGLESDCKPDIKKHEKHDINKNQEKQQDINLYKAPNLKATRKMFSNNISKISVIESMLESESGKNISGKNLNDYMLKQNPGADIEYKINDNGIELLFPYSQDASLRDVLIPYDNCKVNGKVEKSTATANTPLTVLRFGAGIEGNNEGNHIIYALGAGLSKNLMLTGTYGQEKETSVTETEKQLGARFKGKGKVTVNTTNDIYSAALDFFTGYKALSCSIGPAAYLTKTSGDRTDLAQIYDKNGELRASETGSSLLADSYSSYLCLRAGIGLNLSKNLNVKVSANTKGDLSAILSCNINK